MAIKSDGRKHACYCKMGSLNAEEGPNSLDQQVQSVSKCCLSNGWNNFIVYIDADSTANYYRPAFEQMIDDIEKGKINTVVITTTDRLTRSTVHFMEIYSIFKDNNVNLICVDQKINL